MYSLRPGVHWCRANDRVVLLDLRADRYFALPLDTDEAFQHLAAGIPLTDYYKNALAPLVNSGLVSEYPTQTFPVAPFLRTAQRSFIDAPHTSKPPSLEGWLFQALMMRALRRKPLHHLIEQVRARKHRALAADNTNLPARVEAALSGFIASRRLISAQEQCLRWSLAMIEYLARRHCFPDLIVGVRMMPFAAHAWVQIDDMVLSDTLDHIAPYTPILVV